MSSQTLPRARFALVLALAAACQSTGSAGTGPIEFIQLGPKTILVTQEAHGSVTEDHTADPELVGRKEVGIQANFRAPATLESLVLSYSPAGNSAASRSLERAIHQSVEPGPQGTTALFVFEIPGAANFGPCEGIYYMFAANYRLADGTAGVFLGQPHLILPTKKRLANGTIEQSLCAQPPGPGD